MRLLSCWQIEPSTSDSFIESITTIAERAMFAKMSTDAVRQLRIDRHDTSPLRLGVYELERSIGDPTQREPLSLTPSATRNEANHRDQLDVWVPHVPQYGKELIDLNGIEVGQFSLLHSNRTE